MSRILAASNLLYVIEIICYAQCLILSEEFPDFLKECYIRIINDETSRGIPDELIDHHCIQQYQWRTTMQRWGGWNITLESQRWVSRLLHGRQSTGRITAVSHLRVRKEYRVLTNRERFNFNKAVNLLKMDKVSFKKGYTQALLTMHSEK